MPRLLLGSSAGRAPRLTFAAATAAALVVTACSSSGGGGHSQAAGAHTTPSPSTPTELTVGFTGDILAHAPVYERAAADGRATGRAYDFRPMFAEVKPLLSADDLAICHQETPLSATDTDLHGYPVFSSPHEIADAVADAGYDGCSTGSNHSFDKGVKGVTATLDALDAAHVEHVGTARSPEEAARPETHDVHGVKVALLDYTYSLNGLQLPPGQDYLVNLIDVPRILRDAHNARAAGADLVIVQMHWGEEYQAAPTDQQRQQAQQLLASPDVDAIVGGHVHVLQPIDKINGKYVVYGIGNFLSNQSPAAGLDATTQDGAIVNLHATKVNGKWAVTSVSYTPTFVDISDGYLIEPVPEAVADPATPAGLRSQLAASWTRTVTELEKLHPPGVAPDKTAPGLNPQQ